VVRLEVEGREVAVVVRQGCRQRVGLLLRGLGQGGLAGGVELEQLGDPGGRGPVEPPARLREVREPLERVLARRGGVGQGLRVGDGVVPVVAGLQEELGVLPEDLEVFLANEKRGQAGRDDARGKGKGLTESAMGSPTSRAGAGGAARPGAVQAWYPLGAAGPSWCRYWARVWRSWARADSLPRRGGVDGMKLEGYRGLSA